MTLMTEWELNSLAECESVVNKENTVEVCQLRYNCIHYLENMFVGCYFSLHMVVFRCNYQVACYCSYDEVMFGSSKRSKVSQKKFARENKNRYGFCYHEM